MMNPLTIEEDFYVPARTRSGSSRRQTQEEVDADVAYFRECLARALKIPVNFQRCEEK